MGAAVIDIVYFAVLLLVSKSSEKLIDFRLFVAGAFCLLVTIDALTLFSLPDKTSSNPAPETEPSSPAAAIVISLVGNVLFTGLFILLVRAVFT
jgi:hypothetical protein